MKGKITIEVEYDATRISTGDSRYDFVTDVVVDGLSEGLSFKDVQGFKDSIAYGVNEIISLTPDKDIPPEKWSVIDTVWALYYIIRLKGSFDNISAYRNSRYEINFYDIKNFFNQITQNFSPLALEYVSIEDLKTEFISGILFDQLLDSAMSQVNERTHHSLYNLSRTDIKSGLRNLLNNQDIRKEYRISLVCDVLKNVYKVLDEELPYFLCIGSHHSLAEMLDENNCIDIDGISGRLKVGRKLFESQVNVYGLAKENETNQ